MNIFYTPDINKDIYCLSPEESKHCIKVLRLKKDDRIQLIDGKGRKHIGIIQNTNHKQCEVKITQTEIKEQRKDYELILAIAPTKNISRFEVFLEKACEIGVDRIIPILSEHSERRIIKNERLEKILVSAIKQSKAYFKPKLDELTKITEVLEYDLNSEKFIAHCYDSDNKTHIKDVYTRGKDALILIGPEGDFSPDEINKAKKNGFKEISISGSRLRTETAGIVACQIIDFINS
jgi:16S rRNA (uracil1498-N3)-methyltransferase